MVRGSAITAWRCANGFSHVRSFAVGGGSVPRWGSPGSAHVPMIGGRSRLYSATASPRIATMRLRTGCVRFLPPA